MGADVAWRHSGKQHDLATAALSQAAGDDDKSVSSIDEVPASSDPAGSDELLDLDRGDWDTVPCDQIHFPSDQTLIKTKDVLC